MTNDSTTTRAGSATRATVTVGYDASATSRDALHWAADQAALRGDTLQIVSCYRIPVATGTAEAWAMGDAVGGLLAATEQVALGGRDAVLGEHPALAVTTEVSAGPPSMVLLDGTEPDDLLVVGASSHHGAAAFWLGSTPRRVIRKATCPVAVVRSAVTRGAASRVVVGVDGSDASAAALDWAGAAADAQGAELVVVHAWDYPYLAVDTDSEQARDRTEVDGALLLEQAVQRAREQRGAAVSGVLREDTPQSALLGAVRDGDILVLSTRGRGAVAAGLFGSTVNAVLERAMVPVVVVPAPRS